eukprot:snap_masked-scaffold_13-processed-gene-11.33-mRNA-1 protein AED:1.00 eAED:1.00 QI:0/0/0/0/1/1/3/0/60
MVVLFDSIKTRLDSMVTTFKKREKNQLYDIVAYFSNIIYKIAKYNQHTIAKANIEKLGNK